MNTLCKFLTVAAILLHSIFGCGLHRVCACESHEHGESHCLTDISVSGPCDHQEHGCHHEDDAVADVVERAMELPPRDSAVLVGDGCGCGGQGPFEHRDEPCCSDVQCSFIAANDAAYAIEIGPPLFVLQNVDRSLSMSPGLRGRADEDRVRARFDGSADRCAVHCSWQI